MQIDLSAMTSGDINASFATTVMLYRPKDELVFVETAEATIDGTALRVIRASGESDTVHNIHTKMEVYMPESHFFNAGKRACWLKKEAKRQWRLSLNSNMYSIIEVGRKERRALGWEDDQVSTISSRTFLSCCRSGYPSLSDALAEVRSGQALSRAVSPHIALMRPLFGATTLVYYKEALVGYIPDAHSGVCLAPSAAFLIEELSSTVEIMEIIDYE